MILFDTSDIVFRKFKEIELLTKVKWNSYYTTLQQKLMFLAFKIII